MFESGSWSHGTVIAARSDVDFMVWGRYPRPARPSTALERIRDALDASVGIDVYRVMVSSPVVAVEFFSGPHFELARRTSNTSWGDVDVFSIPGRGDEWVLSAPTAHLAYVNRQNDRLNRKLKPLIRLLRAWKHFSGAPISSFYLEMRATEYAAGETLILYEIDLSAVLRKIVEAGARDMNDPLGIVGRIPACASAANRRRVRCVGERGRRPP